MYWRLFILEWVVISWKVSNNNRSDIVLQNANVFISIYIPFYRGKCSYTVIVDASPHLSRLTVSSLLWSSLTIGKQNRLAWCNEKRWWTTQYQWSKVIFSDESQVCIGQKSVYMYGRNVEKDGDRTLWRGERTASSVLWCGMHLLERRMNTY